jgi:indole-3-glycerol phosphate synthase/phosphoribosylanthranilate isomerase/anthranilate synthase/indole-3-glycerol phosphate synthase/phosphoribosylanthranilate isomerase
VILPDASRVYPSVAKAYRRAGAAAISVVTEPDFFGGDLAWLPEVKRASGLPVLMKDFVVDEAQLDLALSLGADAVLLIVAALADDDLARLHRAARARGLAVLVEAHDGEEVRRALEAGAEVVGLNARDLKTFVVDLGRVAEMGRLLPPSAIRVAESGIHGPADVARLAAAGFDAFLVGESLLRSGDPARALRALRGEGTTEVKVCGVTREEDLAAAEELGADWIGLNFSPRSPRRVDLARGRALREASRFAKGVVAVVAGNPAAEAEAIVEAVRPDALQWHDELAARQGLSVPVPLWQAVRVGKDTLEEAAAWPADVLLLDAAHATLPGGTGRTWDWSLLRHFPQGRKVFVAGGLGPANVAAAIAAGAPAGVDVASGVESAPGVKDREKLAAFVAAVRSEKGRTGG